MKKQSYVILLSLAAMFTVTACGGNAASQSQAKETLKESVTETVGESAAEESAEETAAAVEAEEAEGSVQKILWQHAGDLEPQEGADKNIGTAGMLNGMSSGYVIVGGGANFPEGGPEVGGPKVQYPDIYVMKPEEGKLTLVNHTSIQYEIGYGASITSEDGIYYVGGSPVEGKGNKILLVKADESGEISVEEAGELPFTFSDGIAVLRDNTIYVGAGKQDGKASNKFYAYNLESKEIKELESVPGEETRTQSVAQLFGDKLYVFSGGDAVAYTDGYCYDLVSGKWEQVSDVEVDGEKISLLGAGSVKLNDTEMLVVGGFNKEVYDNAVAQMAELKDDALAEFKNGYFGADPSALRWNKKILIYNIEENSWRSIGEVPFDAPCGEALILTEGYVYSVNGEIKPGTRTNRMYGGMLVK